MKSLSVCTALVLSTVLLGGCAVGIESAQYDVIQKSGDFEIRAYPPQVVAETVVGGSLEDAADQAFRPLFNYISGANRSRDKIAMTAPVSQQPQSEKIPMTTPVGQQSVEEGWAVSFLMPATYTLEMLPEPEDSNVTLRQIPARRMAAVRYSGAWSESRYHRHRKSLEEWVAGQGLWTVGEPVWARYNSPFSLWFLRRNEVLYDIEEPSPMPH